MDVLLSDNDDDDLAVFRAVEEGQTLRWSGFNACDVKTSISAEISLAFHTRRICTLRFIDIDDTWAAGGTEALYCRSFSFFSSPNWICLARYC